MAIPQKKRHVSVEEYFILERDALNKSEYYDGEIFAMAGGTVTHSIIVSNVNGELRNLLRGNRCGQFDSNLKIEIAATGLVTYPDASVVCGPPEFSAKSDHTITNPTLIVEVLSDSTEAYHRGKTIRALPHYSLLPRIRADLAKGASRRGVLSPR